MKMFISCKEAIDACLQSKRFAIAYLYNEEKTLNMHIHDCFEIYYSIAGGKQFLIDNKCYDIQLGDVFLINNYQSHYLSQVDDFAHERIVISVSPEFIQGLSSQQTNLVACFFNETNRIRLDKDAQKRFIYLVHKITSADGYGSDLMSNAVFTELLVMICALQQEQIQADVQPQEGSGRYQYNEIVGNVIDYINQNITKRITIAGISEQLFLSEAYLCRLFKAEMGTTINKYLTARRISIAKAKLATGLNVLDACEESGFNDYTNFVQVFTRMVGMTPKKYSQCSQG